MADKDKKKKVEEDDDEGEELTGEVDIEKEGSLSLLGKKKWSHQWFMLAGQDLLYKKSEKVCCFGVSLSLGAEILRARVSFHVTKWFFSTRIHGFGPLSIPCCLTGHWAFFMR
jgi:hypothetical protein